MDKILKLLPAWSRPIIALAAIIVPVYITNSQNHADADEMRQNLEAVVRAMARECNH